MGWEWRYFVRSDTPVAAGNREDIYFPCGAGLGLKLRNGDGMLEEKTRKKVALIEGMGEAEKWKKQLLPDATVNALGEFQPEKYAVACGVDVAEAFGADGPPPEGVVREQPRTHCSWAF